jgi:tetrahydromethanopterin S-methyltransferase subunit G
MNDELEFSDYQMRDILCTMSTLSKERIEMLDSMRNGMLKKLTDELEACKARNKELESTVDRLMAEIAQLKLEEQESLEPSPYQKAMAYENVVNYIARRSSSHKREEYINMFEALLPKDMHTKLRDDIDEKVEAIKAERASKRKRKTPARPTPQITAQPGSTINIIEGTNINHAENVSSK